MFDAGIYSIYICAQTKYKTSKLHLRDATHNLVCLFIDHFTISNSTEVATAAATTPLTHSQLTCTHFHGDAIELTSLRVKMSSIRVKHRQKNNMDTVWINFYLTLFRHGFSFSSLARLNQAIKLNEFNSLYVTINIRVHFFSHFSQPAEKFIEIFGIVNAFIVVHAFEVCCVACINEYAQAHSVEACLCYDYCTATKRNIFLFILDGKPRHWW